MTSGGYTMDEAWSLQVQAKASRLHEHEAAALLSFCGIDPPIEWGAWVSAVMESLHAMGLIVGESDAAPTDLGHEVAKVLQKAEGAQKP